MKALSNLFVFCALLSKPIFTHEEDFKSSLIAAASAAAGNGNVLSKLLPSANEFSFVLNESLQEINASGHIIRGLIAGWYSYDYDADPSAVPSQIVDGGKDLYDKGNIVHVDDNGKQSIDVFYDKYYKVDGFEFASVTGHPFLALLKIDNFKAEKHEYSIRVESNTGADGAGDITVFQGNVSEENFTIDYRVFQVSGATDPTLCEVYFVVHSADKWQSIPPDNFTILLEGDGTNFLDNIVKITGTPSRMVFGYTLLSRHPTSVFTESEIMGVMIVYMNIIGIMQGACQMHNCHRLAVCRNDFVDFTCACREGFYGDGVTNCTDIDECTDENQPNPCHAHSTCHNTIGGHECPCVRGFVYNNSRCEDVNECRIAGYCDPHAECTNYKGSYHCDCRAGYHGNGSFCRESNTFFDVLCHPSSMAIRVEASYYLDRNISLEDLHFSNTSCKGRVDPTRPGYWIFVVPDLSACSTAFTSNVSHLTYSNVLSNTYRGDLVYSGPGTYTEFSCVYQKYLNGLSLFTAQYGVVRNVANLKIPSRSGQFLAQLNYFTDSSYSTKENKTEFDTGDMLYFMAAIQSKDETIRLVIERCWVTPTPRLSDTRQYRFIEDGCPVDTGGQGVVEVKRSGEGHTASFETQVFAFVDYDTTFIHCGMRLCASANKSSCIPSCGRNPTMRNKLDNIVRKLKKRSLELMHVSNKGAVDEEEVLSIGPFHAQRVASGPTSPWFGVSTALTVVVLVFCCTIVCLVACLLFGRDIDCEEKISQCVLKY